MAGSSEHPLSGAHVGKKKAAFAAKNEREGQPAKTRVGRARPSAKNERAPSGFLAGRGGDGGAPAGQGVRAAKRARKAQREKDAKGSDEESEEEEDDDDDEEAFAKAEAKGLEAARS